MSGRRIADLLIKIGADSYEFKQKAREVESGLEKLSKKLDSIGKEMSLKATAPIAALGALAVGLYDVQEKAQAKVRQAVETTGGAAKLTFDELARYASDLQGKSVFSDEKILNDVTAKLLTFTNISGDAFKRTQKAVLDIATVLDKDLGTVAVQLGKALDDPAGKLKSLAKIGISFSEDQQKVIKKFVETNQLAQAQGVILDELAAKYGGQAEAVSKTGIGAMQQLKNSWADFLEKVGSIIAPVVGKLVGYLKSLVDWLQTLNPATLKTIVVIAGLVAAIGPVALGLGTVLKLLPTLKAGLAMLVAPIAGVRTGVMSLSAAIAANPIGLLLTALSLGVGLFMAFSGGAKNAAEANGELTNKVIDESKQVNLLIGKLSSANSTEAERKKALEELRRVQPGIVDGLSAEKVELETLTKRAKEYNQQLVLRIALARKQDQVAAAIDKQTEVGVKQAGKEASLYKTLADIQSKVLSGRLEIGQYVMGQGIAMAQGMTLWREATEQERKKIVAEYSAIMSSGDDLMAKADKVAKLLNGGSSLGSSMELRVDGNSTRDLHKLSKDIGNLRKDASGAADQVRQAEDDVKNFADAFSISLTSAVDTAAGAVGNLGGAAAGRLDSLGTDAAKAKGHIAELGEEIKKLEEKKQAAFDVNQIAEFNEKIAQLKKQVDYLNGVTPDKLVPLEPIPVGDLLPIAPKLEIEIPNLRPMVDKAAEQMNAIHATVREGMYSWAGEMSEGLLRDMMETERMAKNYTDALVDKGWSFGKALEFVAAKIADTAQAFDDTISNFLTNSITAAADAIGQIITGNFGLEDLVDLVLTQMANFLKELGAQMIQFGIMMIAMKSALKSVLANPWAAIAVGAAMVALAGIMTAIIQSKAKDDAPKLAAGGLAFGPTYAMVGDNPNARVDPEVIAPLSKLRGMIAGGSTSNVNLALSGQLVAKGRDLVYVLGKENFKTELLGG